MPNSSAQFLFPISRWWNKITGWVKRTRRDKDKIAVGKYGEELALTHLKEKGFEIIAQNYRCPLGEIDIISRDKTELVFVEVKSRSNTWVEYWPPEAAVNHKKRQRLRRLAEYYIRGHKNIAFTDIRFDIISVVLNQQEKTDSITHIPDAF